MPDKNFNYSGGDYCMRLWEEFTAHLKRGPKITGSTIMTFPSFRSMPLRNGLNSFDAPPGSVSRIIKKDPFKIRLDNMRGVRTEAAMLIEERYMQRGYGRQELTDDPNRLTIVAYEGEHPVGTLSIRFDSQEGLLCDDLYREEINALRKSDRNVCEFIKFAANTSASSLKTLAALFHVAFIYAHRIHGFDDVVIEVNPHHVKFYERSLGFRQIGPERINRRVNAPAILLRGEFSYIGEQIRRYGGNTVPDKRQKSLYPYGFSEREELHIHQRLQAMSNAR